MRDLDEFDQVRSLIAAGMNDCAIARETGVPRTTVRGWRLHPPTNLVKRDRSSPCGVLHEFGGLPAGPYAYLLGLYLGDGNISRARKIWRLRITLDRKYPSIVQRCREAMAAVMPGRHAGIVGRVGCVDVSMHSKHWPCLFPQHGPGKKHDRLIALEAWQQDIVEKATLHLPQGRHRSSRRIHRPEVQAGAVAVCPSSGLLARPRIANRTSRAVPLPYVHYTA